MNKLKLCPFCEAEVNVKWNWKCRGQKVYSIYDHYVNCYLYNQGSQVTFVTKQEAIESWNGRAK